MKQAERIYTTIGVGAAVTLLGIIVFLAAHEMTEPTGSYNMSQRIVSEVCCRAFGLTLLLAGSIVASTGLSAWCQRNEI